MSYAQKEIENKFDDIDLVRDFIRWLDEGSELQPLDADTEYKVIEEPKIEDKTPSESLDNWVVRADVVDSNDGETYHYVMWNTRARGRDYGYAFAIEHGGDRYLTEESNSFKQLIATLVEMPEEELQPDYVEDVEAVDRDIQAGDVVEEE